MKKYIIPFVIVLVFIAGWFGQSFYLKYEASINSFESCSKAWGTKIEASDNESSSYTKTCTTRDDRMFSNSDNIISIFFKQGASSKQIQEVLEEVKDLEGVESVRFMSADEAIAGFKDRHSGDETIMEALDELEGNPLSAYIRVESPDRDGVTGLYESISNLVPKEILDEISYTPLK